MNAGKNHLDQGNTTNAIATYLQAEQIAPHDPAVHRNLAIAHLLAGDAQQALSESDEVLKLEANSAAAWFIKGSAHLRLSNHEEAVKALENAKQVDPGETATLFQLGRARMGLNQWEEAITAFRKGIAMDPNRLHAGPHYLLAQALIRAGRQEEADQQLALHQANLQSGGVTISPATFERSKFTQPQVPFKVDQPAREGIPIRFIDATSQAFGANAPNLSGPLAVIDANHDGSSDFFVLEAGQGFRLLLNTNGTFAPSGPAYPVPPGATYSKALVGDLQNDRFEDIIVLGEQGSLLFKFGTNALATNLSAQAGLSSLRARDGLLIDLDFTGKLDLVAVTTAQTLNIYRQFGPLLFTVLGSTSGIPSTLNSAHSVAMQDWNRDAILDLVVSREQGTPLLLEKQRGGPLAPTTPTNWVPGTVFCAADFDNDLRGDLAIAAPGKITICFNGGEQLEIPLAGGSHFNRLLPVDYDNDGWLDLWGLGETIRAWRNLGFSGFQEQTEALGLDALTFGPISDIRIADFDLDCDPDAVFALAQGGLRYLRNDGGNSNSQIKVQLVGNRSNASGLGCRIEIQTGGLRLIRTVDQLPVEVGVGKHQVLDSFLVHWFNWPQGSTELPVNCHEPVFALELTIQEGSCPYLYAWDGKQFRFITDILGAAPLGLPVAEGRYIESDPEEFVWIGTEESFPPRAGHYELQITEELREALYLDEAKLVIVDHEPGTEVHPTDKLLPRAPFPSGSLMTLHREHPLLKAETLNGHEVTARLQRVDGQRVSPPTLLGPQLRGLAEPHGYILDFGPLDTRAPLVLVLNGWLRFGGGMANIAASHDPSLPFPFPELEAEIAPGQWQPVHVTVGAPAGKTKTILADLEGKLKPGTRRLRLTHSFEIHWDRMALLEKVENPSTGITFVPPGEANLHFRGFSVIQDLPPDWPLTPDYGRVTPNYYWTLIPGGWCTRYGDVRELIAYRDEGLAILNAGDELTLKFPVHALPPKPPGSLREFFLYADGWDKDSDFHVATGTQVEPLPFHGMNDQLYGREPRPPFPSDALHQKYNTRWVEGKVLKRTASAP